MFNWTLQDFLTALPKPVRRIRVAQFLSRLTGSPYHQVSFQTGKLIGNLTDRSIGHILVTRHVEDYGYYRLARALLHEGGVHVDVGANYGFYTIGLLDQPLAATIVYLLIDANPDCVKCHGLTSKLYPDYQLIPLHCALSNSTGNVQLSYSPSFSAGGCLGSSQGSNLTSITVPCDTLDNIVEAQEIKTIDLLKMDIEGSEVSALKGAQRCLSSGLIRSIYFEVNHAALSLQGTSLQAIVDILAGHGYQLFWPHAALDWILLQYNNQEICSRDINIFEYQANLSLQLAQFNMDLIRPLEGGQFDLLAFPEAIAVNFKRIIGS